MRHFITLLTLFVVAVAAQESEVSSPAAPANSSPLKALTGDVSIIGNKGIGVVQGNIDKPIFNFNDSPLTRLLRPIDALLDQIINLLGQIASPLPPDTPGAGLIIRTLIQVRAILINVLNQVSTLLGRLLQNDIRNLLNKTVEILGLAANKLGIRSSEISKEIDSPSVIGSGIEAVPALLQAVIQIIIGIVVTVI